MSGGSINYERIVGDNVALRVGLGYGTHAFLDRSRRHLLGGIIMAQYMTPGSHRFEVGAGVRVPIAGGDIEERSLQSIRLLAASVGYRYQPSDGGSMFRAGGSFMLNGEVGLHIGWGVSF